MWTEATCNRSDLVSFLNEKKISPGEIIIIAATESRTPDDGPAKVNFIYWKKN